jgi:hypothetical protein
MLDQVEGLRDILAAHSNHIQAKEVPTRMIGCAISKLHPSEESW